MNFVSRFFRYWLYLAFITGGLGSFALDAQAQWPRSSIRNRQYHGKPLPLPLWLDSQKPSLIGEILEDSPSWLVRCEIVKPQVKIEGKLQSNAVARILHVYAGPATLRGVTFEMEADSPSWVTNGTRRRPDPMQASQQFIFSVGWRYINPYPNPEERFSRSGLGLSRTKWQYQLYHFGWYYPATLDGSPLAQEVEAHAKRVEAVYKADLAQQRRMLLYYAENQLALTSAWAIHSIFQWKQTEARLLLWELAHSEKKSLDKMMVLEDGLLDFDTYEWTQSSVRTTLFQRAASLPMTLEVARSFAGQMSTSLWDDNADYYGNPDFIKSLALSMARNNSFPFEAQGGGLNELLGLALREKVITPDEFFDIWIQILEDPRCDELSFMAATDLNIYYVRPKFSSTPARLSRLVRFYSLRMRLEARRSYATPQNAFILKRASGMLQLTPIYIEAETENYEP